MIWGLIGENLGHYGKNDLLHVAAQMMFQTDILVFFLYDKLTNLCNNLAGQGFFLTLFSGIAIRNYDNHNQLQCMDKV